MVFPGAIVLSAWLLLLLCVLPMPRETQNFFQPHRRPLPGAAGRLDEDHALVQVYGYATEGVYLRQGPFGKQASEARGARAAGWRISGARASDGIGNPGELLGYSNHYVGAPRDELGPGTRHPSYISAPSTRLIIDRFVLVLRVDEGGASERPGSGLSSQSVLHLEPACRLGHRSIATATGNGNGNGFAETRVQRCGPARGSNRSG